MARFFNTAGVCEPEDHYMLPPRRRLPDIDRLIDQKAYFVVHAPRQSGKTTCFHHLAKELTAAGRYAALLTSCETASVSESVERGIDTVIYALFHDARIELPEALRPEPPESVAAAPAEERLKSYLAAWAERCPLPVVLFLDEIDAIFGSILLSILRQLRSGYRSRPDDFPHAVALIGLRDVRDYQVPSPLPAESPEDAAAAVAPVVRELRQLLGTASPFNIKVESVTLANFTAKEVAELYDQHTAETGQDFTAEAKDLAYGLTRGQPWLVNALARQAVTREAPDPMVPVTAEHIERAKPTILASLIPLR